MSWSRFVDAVHRYRSARDADVTDIRTATAVDESVLAGWVCGVLLVTCVPLRMVLYSHQTTAFLDMILTLFAAGVIATCVTCVAGVVSMADAWSIVRHDIRGAVWLLALLMVALIIVSAVGYASDAISFSVIASTLLFLVITQHTWRRSMKKMFPPEGFGPSDPHWWRVRGRRVLEAVTVMITCLNVALCWGAPMFSTVGAIWDHRHLVALSVTVGNACMVMILAAVCAAVHHRATRMPVVFDDAGVVQPGRVR